MTLVGWWMVLGSEQNGLLPTHSVAHSSLRNVITFPHRKAVVCLGWPRVRHTWAEYSQSSLWAEPVHLYSGSEVTGNKGQKLGIVEGVDFRCFCNQWRDRKSYSINRHISMGWWESIPQLLRIIRLYELKDLDAFLMDLWAMPGTVLRAFSGLSPLILTVLWCSFFFLTCICTQRLSNLLKFPHWFSSDQAK